MCYSGGCRGDVFGVGATLGGQRFMSCRRGWGVSIGWALCCWMGRCFGAAAVGGEDV